MRHARYIWSNLDSTHRWVWIMNRAGAVLGLIGSIVETEAMGESLGLFRGG